MPYITVAQLASVLLMVGGIGVLLWAFRRTPGAAGRATPPQRSTAEVDQVMSDARELADLLADRLDRQAQRLESLLAAADDKIRRLERLENLSTRAPEKPQADPLNKQVYDLCDQGLPPVEIARKLDQHTGKVELILALRRR